MAPFTFLLNILIFLENTVISHWLHTETVTPRTWPSRNVPTSPDFTFPDAGKLSPRMENRDSCITQHGSVGICLDIHQCPYLLGLLKRHPVSPSDIEILRRATCGFQGFTPLVCCSLHGTRSGNGYSPGEGSYYPTNNLYPHKPLVPYDYTEKPNFNHSPRPNYTPNGPTPRPYGPHTTYKPYVLPNLPRRPNVENNYPRNTPSPNLPRRPFHFDPDRPQTGPDLTHRPNFRPDVFHSPDFKPDIHRETDFKPGVFHRPDFKPDIPHGPNFKPDEPHRPDFKPDEPHRPDFKPDEPHRPDFKPDEPHRPDFKPDEPHRPDFKPDEPHRPDFKPDGPHRPDFKPDGPHRPDFKPDEPRRPDFKPDEPRRPDLKPDEPHRPDFKPDGPHRPDFKPDGPHRPDMRPNPNPGFNHRPTPKPGNGPDLKPDSSSRPDYHPDVASSTQSTTKVSLHPNSEPTEPIPVPRSNSTSTDSHRNRNLLPTERCGLSLEERIVGGKEAALGAYPWIALIGYVREGSPNNRYFYRCGGALINSRYVVTAAHCVRNLPGGLQLARVRLGEHNISSDLDCDYQGVCADIPQDFRPEEVTIHPKYDDPKYRHDIALIRLDRDVIFTSYVHPICLPFGPLITKDYTGNRGIVAGWGITSVGNSGGTSTLQYVSLSIVRNDACAAAFRNQAQIGEEQLCAGGQDGKDSCEGDSGGPLMRPEQPDGMPRYFIIGIVSFGAKSCGTVDLPGVYTRVSSYLPWILDTVRE